MTGGVLCSGLQGCSYLGMRLNRVQFKILTSYKLTKKEKFCQHQVSTHSKVTVATVTISTVTVFTVTVSTVTVSIVTVSQSSLYPDSKRHSNYPVM